MTSLALDERPSIPRNELFAVSMAIGVANGLVEVAWGEVAKDGLWAALGDTLGVSAIVWVAAAIGLRQTLRGGREAASWTDLLAVGAVTAAFFLPASKVSWLALTALALYIGATAGADLARRQGAAIILAVTVPMFWSRLVFSMLSRWILQADAILVSWVTGLKRVGNTLDMGAQGQLWIASGCSSLANISLCLLCWSVIVTLFKQRRPTHAALVCLAACAAVVVLNVGRISLIGLHPQQYELLHGPIGATVAGYLITAAIVGICWWGLDHDAVKMR